MRVKLGLTQAELAEMAGVTQAYIAKIEAGDADPRVSTLERITKALEKIPTKGPTQTIERIMSSPTVSVKPTDTVERAIKIMEKQNISQLPVIEIRTQVGSLSENTLLRHMAPGGKVSTMLKTEVSEIMDEPFPTVAKDESVEVVYPLLEQKSAVLVVDRGRIVGIVTKADLFKLRGHYEQNLSTAR